jgi:NAD(P)-dependent dehydrogenase (short-subunit alcohol dehydrogenase family)
MAQKVWMITGASRGLGAEIGEAVLGRGEKLIATARHVRSLDYLNGHGNLITACMDVTVESQVESAVNEGLSRFGRIDVVVNNAGFGILGAIEETSAEQVEQIFRTNVFGVLNVIRAVLPVMRRQQSGHIINFSSLGGYRASAGWGVYCATKFAVEGLTEALHDEVAPFGIHATVVEPGHFRTDFMDDRSLCKSSRQIADYAKTLRKTRAFAGEENHRQPGNPARLAAAIIALADAADPPLRLPLGDDALDRIEDKNAFVERETAKWRCLSTSTGY